MSPPMVNDVTMPRSQSAIRITAAEGDANELRIPAGSAHPELRHLLVAGAC